MGINRDGMRAEAVWRFEPYPLALSNLLLLVLLPSTTFLPYLTPLFVILLPL